jgi:hypothetical protein
VERDRRCERAFQGAAYLFKNQGGSWTQAQKVVADDGGLFDNFGQSVAIDGTRIVVGANGATIGDQGAQGAAYIFDRDGSAWVQQQKIWSDDGDTVDNFGNAVAMRGSTLFVGALQAMADGNVNQGAVYVFTDDGSGTWSQVQKLTSSDGGAGDAFGASVSFDGTTLVVGAVYATGRAPRTYSKMRAEAGRKCRSSCPTTRPRTITSATR